ncbi:hypothetical protein NMY22_g12652 [Coprinellus aureogranulatus]|nr:hypothetical protein NMY22_g12652 [Coprinellus aureogranulatus]
MSSEAAAAPFKSPNALTFRVIRTSLELSLGAALQRAIEDETLEDDIEAEAQDAKFAAEIEKLEHAVKDEPAYTPGGLAGGVATEQIGEKQDSHEPPFERAPKRKRGASWGIGVEAEGVAGCLATSPADGAHCTQKDGSRRAYKKLRKTAARKGKQMASFESNAGKPLPPKAIQALATATAVQTPLIIQDLPTNSTGYEATFDGPKEGETLGLQELISEGYEEIQWDGRQPLVLADSETNKPHACSLSWPQREGLYRESLIHKRGQGFAAVNFGNGAGHGPPEPYNLRKCADQHPKVIDALLESSALSRLALHQSSTFQSTMPKLYAHYHSHTIPIRKRLTHLVPNWDKSIFSAAACNLGEQVATCLHRDCRNLPFGFCVVHALGAFEHTQGCHIILKEPKLVVQFPSGTHILLPSAVITHGNTPVKQGETRASFTQYTAGAMFRYADCGYTTLKRVKKGNKALYRKILADNETRWQRGLELWPTVDELLNVASPDGNDAA